MPMAITGHSMADGFCIPPAEPVHTVVLFNSAAAATHGVDLHNTVLHSLRLAGA